TSGVGFGFGSAVDYELLPTNVPLQVHIQLGHRSAQYSELMSAFPFSYFRRIGKSLARIISSYNPKRLILPVRNRKKSNDGNVECIELWDMDLADLHS
ncbi:22_t:CDS:2, partial [Gigaspora rosea]